MPGWNRRRLTGVGVGVGLGRKLPRREVVVIERGSLTTDESFHINEPGRSLPVDGPGTLISAFVVADSDQFGVYLSADDEAIADETFVALQANAAEMPRISAYQRPSDDLYVFGATDYEFLHAFDCVIQPDESITFDIQRAEIDLFREG